jgi:hypothetical protein
MASLMIGYGVQHLFAAIVRAGLFQVAFGLLRWASSCI